MNPAPIALFAYNRPRHLARVAEALARNPEARASRLFVYCDAPRSAAASAQVAEVKAVAHAIRGFQSIDVIEPAANKGVARSVIDGVTDLAGRYGRVIVLEDDLLPSPHFLRFVNGGLDLYESDDRVASIHAYSYPVAGPLPETFFLRGADCWGWGTWSRGWALFEPDGRRLLEEMEARGLAHAFDFDGRYPYTQMLRDQVAGRNDSWAVRWHASAFLKERFTLYPGSSQIQNIGADGTGSHVGRTRAFEHAHWGRAVQLDRIPVEESARAREAFGRFLAGLRPTLVARVLGKLNGLRAAFR
jgi:hypothetical protein